MASYKFSYCVLFIKKTKAIWQNIKSLIGAANWGISQVSDCFSYSSILTVHKVISLKARTQRRH